VVFHGPGGLAEARRVLDEAEASREDPVRRLLARAELAGLLTYAGRLAEALAIGGPLIAPDMDVRVRLRSLSPVGMCMVFAGRAGRVLALCDEFDEAAARLREELPEAVGWVWSVRTSTLLLAGQLNEVTAVLAGPLEPGAAPIVGEGHLAYARTKLGRALLLQGRAASALCHLTGAAAVLRVNEPVGCLVWCLSLAAEAHALLGHPVEAGRLAQEAMMRRPSGFALFDGDAARARAWVTAAAGERSRAIGHLIRAADDQESRGQSAFAVFALHDALRLGAQHVADRLRTLAASLDGPWPAAAVIHARAAEVSDAASLEAAAATEASRLWAASGHAARAATARAKATRLSPCAVGNALTFIPQRPDAPVIATLTRREQEVAALACHGLSNADIAGKLVVSVRTVESHLYSAYGKLGVSDRAELAAVLGPQ
jgi:DNA-binding NarL/FixJ family response regulator